MQVLRHRAAIGGEQGDQEHEVLPRRRVDRGRRFRQPSGKCQVTHVTRVIAMKPIYRSHQNCGMNGFLTGSPFPYCVRVAS